MTVSRSQTSPAGVGSLQPVSLRSLPTPHIVPFTCADRCCLTKEWSGIDINEFPSLKKWLYSLLERPGFEKGRNVPTEHKAFKMAELSEEELEKMAAGPRAWVQAGMKQDAAK